MTVNKNSFIKPEPKDDDEKLEIAQQAMGVDKPKGTFHRLEIEKADNGFTVHTTHRTPRKQTAKDSYPDYDHDHKTNVFSHDEHDKMIGHIIGVTKQKS